MTSKSTRNESGAEEGVDPVVRRSFLRRHRWIWWLAGTFFTGLIVLAVALSIVARHIEPFIRARIVDELQQRFHTHVELAEFHISVHHGQDSQWGLWATGRGLRIWPPHGEGSDQLLETTADSKPLIDLGEFGFHVPLRSETTMRLHIAEARLKNLVIDVPPRSERDKLRGNDEAMDSSASQMKPEGETGQQATSTEKKGTLAGITVDRVICEGAVLRLETDKPNKVPLQFDIVHLKLGHVAAGKAMDFEAELTNPRPQGMINAVGSFGPWVMADPGESPVSGKYHFAHADLGTFNGIAGILTSNGSYTGTLRQILVVGETDVPDFRLTSFGNSLPLHAQFHARVDGTDGDTWLEPVDATLGRSHFTTHGKVVRVLMPGAAQTEMPSKPQQTGRLIDLKVEIDHGNLEDFMGLVGRTPTSQLTGDLAAHAVLHLPPGREPVQLRLKLDGDFKLTDVHFTSQKIQDRVEELSLRGQGRPKDMKTTDSNSISSEMGGSFHVNHGIIALPDLRYAVPGADIALNGSYAFDGKLNFEGTARMEATVSKIVGGWKGILLKPVDRFFRKDGSGTLVPIHVRGMRDAPEVGIDFGRMKETSPEKPDGTKQKPPPDSH